MPKVSVIVPVCNVERYVKQCIDSILHQSLREIEIICIDDGSKDESGKILDEYASEDSRLQVIHKPNTGYGHSMNVGLQKAAGEYVAILESDDFAEENMLELLYSAAIDHSADIVKGNYFGYRDGKDTYRDRLIDFPENKILCIEDCPELLELADTIWSGLYRRQFLIDNRISFNETPGASFQDISFALLGWLYAKRVYFIKDAVLHYRQDNPGSSMKAPGKTFCVFDEYERVEKCLPNISLSNHEIENYFTAVKYKDYLNHYRRVASIYQYALLIRLAGEAVKDMKAGKLCEQYFKPVVWKEICEICENVNAFFLKTVKDMRDIRLDYCSIENDQVYYNAFIEKLKSYSKVIIYGAGSVGKRAAKRLQCDGVSVTCFAVTESDDSFSECMGMPVKAIASLADDTVDCAVLIAVTEGSQYEMYMTLQQLEFKNIYRVDPLIRKYIE